MRDVTCEVRYHMIEGAVPDEFYFTIENSKTKKIDYPPFLPKFHGKWGSTINILGAYMIELEEQPDIRHCDNRLEGALERVSQI